MITINGNYQNLEENSQIFQLRGFSVSEINTKGNFEIIFQKGIGITLNKKIVDLYKSELLKKRQGYVKDNIGNLTVYINFFERNPDQKLIIMYIDKTENLMNYTSLYHLSKIIYNNISSETSENEIKNICNNIINIPKAKGLIGIFIIDKA
ncbi:MAG: hypothetical protein ACFE9N_16470, partial [Promethearchaeota archaeon]